MAAYDDASHCPRGANVLPIDEIRSMYRRVVDARSRLYRSEIERISQENQQREGENLPRHLGDTEELAQTIENLLQNLEHDEDGPQYGLPGTGAREQRVNDADELHDQDDPHALDDQDDPQPLGGQDASPALDVSHHRLAGLDSSWSDAGADASGAAVTQPALRQVCADAVISVNVKAFDLAALRQIGDARAPLRDEPASTPQQQRHVQWRLRLHQEG